MPLRIYKKKLDYSYTFGSFPVIEMLKKIPEKVITVLISEQYQRYEGIDLIKSLCKKNDINYDLSTHTIRKLSVKENTIAIGVFKKYQSKLMVNQDHLFLDNPSDMGNVGTIIRTMIGFGINNLAIIRPGVDIFDPKVIRTTMGAIFDLHFEFFNSFQEYKNLYPDNNNFYPFLLKGDSELTKIKFEQPATLIFGNEGRGLDDFYKKLGKSIKISHSENIDSLNLSIAVGIALHQFYVQK
ncbi:hypothetical protein A2V49_03855 [candidate division WWE3 bacterium RBG_19FT_COMBO_34_6]|uniref:tRNA/rRNA methyltransferase SpoU type domain-containing protein n=1 Tax=candidate division WWE3 bacterium RBG_19FT_COMBO_34_6 TaxID=1802612 RepID=A0A1F4ULC8_UNCKA|nr:MAG: hypothetical protein A2V49_03855 [candidate division WWE3 bacterium RBG_19FT_COMBO_34_6]